MTTNIYPQGVDESLLMSQYAEDAWEFFVELFDLFMTDARAQLSGLEMAVASQDFATIKSIAHRLKGSSPTIGAGQLASDFFALEMAAKAESASETSSILMGIQSQMAMLETYSLP